MIHGINNLVIDVHCGSVNYWLLCHLSLTLLFNDGVSQPWSHWMDLQKLQFFGHNQKKKYYTASGYNQFCKEIFNAICRRYFHLINFILYEVSFRAFARAIWKIGSFCENVLDNHNPLPKLELLLILLQSWFSWEMLKV